MFDISDKEFLDGVFQTDFSKYHTGHENKDYQLSIFKLYKKIKDESKKVDGKYKENYELICKEIRKDPKVYLELIYPNENISGLTTQYHNYLSVLNNTLKNMNTSSGGSFLYGGGNEDDLNNFISKINDVVIEDKK